MSVTADIAPPILRLTTLMAYKEKLLGVTLLLAILIVVQFQRIRTAISFLIRRIQGLLYLFFGPEIIDHAYKQAKGKTFKVSTPSNDHLLITSTALIRELINAPLQHLSLHAVAKERKQILQPKYTMCGFELHDNRGIEGTGYVRALRSLLTSHLPKFQPDLERIMKDALEAGLSEVRPDGFAHVKIFPFMKTLVTRVNCFVFFGEELSQNTEFTSAALELPQAVVFAAELLRITPEFMRPLVASIATNRHRAARRIYHYLVPIIEQRLAVRELQSSNEATPTDCMQWLIDTSPRKNLWTPAKIAGEIMAVWFGSVHQLAIHADAVDCCFIKESVRSSNFDAITCRRKALVPYTFQDGSSINKGDWVCVPQRAMMQDNTRYRDPQIFDGFRFARANVQLQQHRQSADVPDQRESKFTDTSPDWPIWGIGNAACPGRFYASLVTKLILIHILEDWECKMPDPEAPRSMTWRSSIVPRSSTIIMLRKKELQ
ncbi:uncharacterized protein TRIVIDRAFT_200187 [Trichoderma virens Gv29-8]|uniref:Cytochrome P450 n=1 Tax=Hypocrea virens (strain Gv29-8 / FGSC 10586) TaxID=413071 RepID=G9MPQ5_HYPVG|nr:uncharacterized protein TRIVIDRAFT_200187 [Trichoderma virens Gv29-8]EHK23856.1 hypothetical protein TRIVIDRAFT_200187 [Trichoderma virens Gv29-8]UKZ50162.1 hypothetical protein TrVGV298_004418 [Trichoderma virens]